MTNKSLYDVIERTVELAGPRASEAGLSIRCDIDPHFRQLHRFDERLFSQLLSNLLSNAITYTADGEVSVAGTCSPATDGSDEQPYEVTVADTGPGISPPIRRIMFTLPEEREGLTDYPEIGVGLIIAKQLSDMLHATLTIDSGMGQGTVARIQGQIAPGETSDTAMVFADALRNTFALVIDSNIAARRLLEAHLRAWGIDVQAVLDINAGIAAAARNAEQGRGISMVFVRHDTNSEGLANLNAALAGSSLHRNAMLVVVGSDLSTTSSTSLTGTAAKMHLATPLQPSALYDCIAQHPDIRDEVERQVVASATADGDQRRVLLVEDNVVNQCVAKEILKRIGVAVAVANDGVEAVDFLQRESVDFVFMDCQMPNMDGFDATREIRQRLGLTKLPVVALTANALAGDRERCLNAGMSDYLAKPFTKDQLERMLDKWTLRQPSGTSTFEEPAVISDEKLLDTKALGQIRMLDEAGQSTIFDEIVSEYLNSAVTLTGEIDTAVTSVDTDTVARIAHALKSSSAAVGLAFFSTQCAELERLGKNSDGGAVTQLWAEMKPIHERSMALLTRERERQVA